MNAVQEWPATIEPVSEASSIDGVPVVRTLDLIGTDQKEIAANTLLGNRFLCRGGALLFVGPSGVGKSSFILQALIRWSRGQPHFGIRPHGALRVLLVQAENDDGDLAEIRDGVFRGLGLSAEDRAASCERIKVVCESSATGDTFVALAAQLVREHEPDLICVDPLFAYLGGAVDQETCSCFLRNGLNPILQENGCGLILVHHTNKPSQGQERAAWQAGDFAYLGSGTSELANWARAVIAIRSVGSHDVFQLLFPKRGKRAGIVGEDGEPVFHIYVKHGATGICWMPADETEALRAGGKRPAATVEDVLQLIPSTGAISQAKLFNSAEAAGIGEKRLRSLLGELVEERRVHLLRTPRPGTNPAKSYSRQKLESLHQ